MKRPALIILLLMIPVSQPAFGNDLESKASRDPQGWQNFKWGMSKEGAAKLGAKMFKDESGMDRFGLPSAEVLPGKSFRVDLGFFTHMQLVYIHLDRILPNTCPKAEYDTLLKQLRNQFGSEKESKNINYPNSTLSSHLWAVGTTKTKLMHQCTKPGKTVSVPVYSTSVTYERRRHVEPWNQ